MLNLELAKIKSGFRLISMVIAGLILSSNMGCGEKDDPCYGNDYENYYHYQLINSTDYKLVIRGFKDGGFLARYDVQKNSRTNIDFAYSSVDGWSQ